MNMPITDVELQCALKQAIEQIRINLLASIYRPLSSPCKYKRSLLPVQEYTVELWILARYSLAGV